MGLLTAYAPVIVDAVMGGTSFPRYNAANAHIGIGNSSALFDPAQTGLQGLSIVRKPMDATYPQRTNNIYRARATFAKTEANYRWEEWEVTNAATGGNPMNRMVDFIGEKTSSATWQITVEVQHNIP